MNVLFIGDIHGNYDALCDLVKRAKKATGNEKLDIYTVGDLIDRGSDSKKVIQFCIDNKIKSVLGNHELWLREIFDLNRANTRLIYSKIMGASETLTSYGIQQRPLSGEELARLVNAAVPEEHKKYIMSLPLVDFIEYEDKVFVLTHGGIPATDFYSYLAEQREQEEYETSTVDAVIDSFCTKNPEIITWVGCKPHASACFGSGWVQVTGHTPRCFAQYDSVFQFISLDTGSSTCAPFRLSSALVTRKGVTIL